MKGKENYLRYYRHEYGEWFPTEDDLLSIHIPGDRPFLRMGEEGRDLFGVRWICTQAAAGPCPAPNAALLDSFEDWRSKIKVPDNAALDALDWATLAANTVGKVDRDQVLVEAVSFIGFFERMHSVADFETTLCSFYSDPEEVKDFLEAMTSYKKHEISLIHKWLRPDVLVFHDDYGTQHGMFLSREMWREFFYEPLKEIIDYTHSLGMLYEHHSCGYITPIVGDLVEAGADALQPLQIHNDLRYIKEQFGRQITLVGGLDATLLMSSGLSPEKIAESVRTNLGILCSGPGYVPIKYYRRTAPYIKGIIKDFEAGYFAPPPTVQP